MPLQLLSRPTTDTVRSRSPSPLSTPAPKPQIPTICLTTATPCDANRANDVSQVAPWTASEASQVPIALKSIANGVASRKRLVPKKSKLGLLGSSSSSAKAREEDFSDVVRRVGGASVENGSNGFEIYVDPANDPDIGDILMVKKKKSRLALDGIQWGTLEEVTNVPSVAKPKEKRGKKDSLLKVKADENQKWWTIGRGRKDSKEKDKTKEKDRAKSPQPTNKTADSRARFNSLDSGILLANPVFAEPSKCPVERDPTPPSIAPAPPAAAASGGGRDSVAIRAMRSVRSLARIGSWAQLKSIPNPDTAATTTAPVKDKESDGKKKKKKRDKDKDKDKAKETIRYSGSSFEAGALTASPVGSKNESKSLGKKASILGLGLPSTMRLPSTRSGSTGSSVIASNTARHRLSVDSATLLGGGILARGRSGSTMSTASSIRPRSAKSCVSRESSGSSGAASVKWDEAGLQTVKEIRRKDKEARSKEKENERDKRSKEKEGSKEKKKLKKSKSMKDSDPSDSRKRTPLAAIFPGIVSEREGQPPVTVDRHEHGQYDAEAGDSPMDTPMKRVRPRPISEQPLGRSQPKPFCEGEDDNAAISLLDAATNDLAQLINRLDLEATPGSVEMTPMSERSAFSLEPSNSRLTAESPVKGLRRTNSSMTSLKPYAQSCSKCTGIQLGQNIAPWSTLNAGISPLRPSPSTVRVNFQDNAATVRSHRRTMTPAPAADPSPVFKALRPATSHLPMSKPVVAASTGISPFVVDATDRSPSCMTFGSGHSKSESRGSLSKSPVFKKFQGHARKGSSLVPHGALDSSSLPILPEVRRSLGLAGTMGGSVGSIAEQDFDGSDPDSDIPDELQIILSNSDQEGEDTISFHPEPAQAAPASPGLPPEIPLPLFDGPSPKSFMSEVPVFRTSVIDEDDHHADIEEAGTLSEDDTKRSFDFTGELQKLNESGASDRRSFIEQLENAFRTPAKIDLRHDFGDLPPIPKLNTLQDELSRVGENSFALPMDCESRELSPRGFPIDVNAEPTLLPGSDSFATTAPDEEPLDVRVSEVLRSAPSVASRPSDGQLNRDFKFGGKNSSSIKRGASLLTLSDIIPPPEVARALSMASFADDDNSLMKSILAHAIKIESPPERPRLDSDASSRRSVRDGARNPYLVPGHQRNSSLLSFVGFDSFAEVRRGFEFTDNRPGFYPPATSSDRQHRKHESFYSIASVSSYGNVLHSGSADPFDYGSIAPLPSVKERPSSDNFSFTMSTSVDDTFSFLRRQPLRHRVDSDASSFCYRTSLAHPYNRSHRRPESGVSLCPPISLLNRNSTYHRRGDSSTSMSSTAQSHGNCQRFSWNRPRSNISIESVLSDFSSTNLGRPGLGDKMLDSAQERGTPLTSISASPSPSLAGSIRRQRIYSEECDNPTSYDSIMDTRHEFQKTDSLFEKTSRRNSVCSSDSTFFEQQSDDTGAKPPRYRPISSLSIPSVHSPPKEDDTMISMLGGGHVRRRSVTSMIEASPCTQVERRKNILANPPETVFSRIKNVHPEDPESPEISRVIESKPSIASTVNSFKFGDDRMIRAKHGLLERQSLENTVLIGDGEDLSGSLRMPVFTRPSCANRSRSSTCTSISGAETPPLSISDGYSSLSEGSLSSIDLSQLSILLSNTVQPPASVTFDRARPYGRGHGHRRRISQARASRTSVYETIEEELIPPPSHMSSPKHAASDSTSNNTVKLAEAVAKSVDPPQVYVVDPETSSVDSYSLLDDERGIAALRRYYALRDEAEDAVTESQRTWLDTPFSNFAVQSFDPPRHPSGMRAMLEHSLQTFGPLPSELRPHRMRSRVNSRPSPYPRTVKTSFTSSPSAEHLRATVAASLIASVDNAASPQVSPLSNALQQISINPNIPLTVSAESKECVVSPEKPVRVFGRAPQPRAGSTTRRAALGLSKKGTGRNGVDNKENNVTIGNVSIGASTVANVSQGTMRTPADGLRLNRPRPRGRR